MPTPSLDQYGKHLAVDGRTVARYLDLMVDLLLVRTLPPYHGNAAKRLVKSPKTYARDSGLVHALFSLDSRDSLVGFGLRGRSCTGIGT